MDILLETTFERDIDLLVLEEFVSDKQFAMLFLKAVNVSDDFKVVKAIHSLTDVQYGESDIVFVLQINNKKHALHIENKINAKAQPEQFSRYLKRAQKEQDNGHYDSFSIMILAPQKYLDVNEEAKKYTYMLSYEQLLAHFKTKSDIRSKYKYALIEKAIQEKGNGYQWEANPHVVRFCHDMYRYQADRFPGMTQGTVAWWPTFKTIHKDIEVQFKANHGHCDLAFTKTPYAELYRAYMGKIGGKMQIVETGKSSAIRISVSPINFENEFIKIEKEVHEALAAIKILLDFANSL